MEHPAGDAPLADAGQTQPRAEGSKPLKGLVLTELLDHVEARLGIHAAGMDGSSARPERFEELALVLVDAVRARAGSGWGQP
jgi:hypothetical protein